MNNNELQERKEVIENDIIYEINEDEKTANVVGYVNKIDNVTIPVSIKYGTQEFIVIAIKKDSFKNSTTLLSISFPFDSKVQLIERESFSNSTLKDLSIPASILTLEEGWCKDTPNLIKITIAPNNPYLIFSDGKMIIEKTDKQSDKYDSIIFACRDVKRVIIPSFVTKISPFAFSECSIEKVFIPSQVIQLCEGSFHHCTQLKTIKIAKDSKLQTIQKDAITGTSVNCITIRPRTVNLEEGWCDKSVKIKRSVYSKEYRELKKLFIFNPSAAINKSQQLICKFAGFDSFNDFYQYHLEHPHISTCQNDWSMHRQMSLHCVECSVNSLSCFCLECFLNSNHEGHEYLIRPNSYGNCDCGDLSQWKRCGFCNKHQGLENDSHPEDYLKEDLRILLVDFVFRACFSSFFYLLDDRGEQIPAIIQFLESFLKFGDGFRRLLAISLTDKINFDKLFDKIFEASIEFNQSFQKFCGLLINDQLFKNNFARINYRITIEQTIPRSIKALTTFESNEVLNYWDPFWFHSYTVPQFKYNIEQYGWNWVKFAVQVQNSIKELLSFDNNQRYNDEVPDYLFSNINIFRASEIQPNEQTQNLFDQLYTQVLTTGTSKAKNIGINDTIIYASFKQHTESNEYRPHFNFNLFFYNIFKSFKNKENLKLDKMFESMDKFVDITPIFLIGSNVIESGNENENDKLVSRFINQVVGDFLFVDNYYKSFHNGASFFFSFPLYYSFAFLFRNDEITRIKIAKSLSMKNYQSLRVRLGIVTLKSLLALVCLHQSLVPKFNFSICSILINYVNRPSIANFGIPLLFPLFQLLIGLQCNENSQIDEFCLKEFFAFEMAREIGLFDDFSTQNYEYNNIVENQKQMIFTFLYLSILLIVERTLFHFDPILFIKEQIIFALKQGCSDLNQLKDMFDTNITQAGHYIIDLNKIISEVATARQKTKRNGNNEEQMISSEQDVAFILKENIETKCISAINSFNSEKVLMNDEISKHPEKLIQIQQFEPEETFFFNPQEENGLNIKLKDFLMTPTVLAIVYHTLRSDSEFNSNKVELNDHLAMNILILISKFVQEIENENENYLIDEITYNSTIVDLISQFKQVIFNHQIDDNQNATIQNTLTKDTFNSLLKIKIGSDSQPPKSFIDLLIEKGELGKYVLMQMSVEIEGLDNPEKKNDINTIKKMRANKLKEDIMNHFKTITANFNANDDQNDDLDQPPTNSEADVCSICSMSRKNEVLSFPLYIYKTKFPFIVDKPPLVPMTIIDAMREKDILNDEEVCEEEEEEINDPEEMFANFVFEHPELDITSDLDAEQVDYRRSILDLFHQTFIKRYEQIVKERKAIKEEREKRRQLKKEKEEEERKRKELELENSDMLIEKRVTAGNPFVIQFGICQHLIHHDCVERGDFSCPIDRSTKNGFLPNISGLSKEAIFAKNSDKDEVMNLSDELKEALNLFILRYSFFFFQSEELVKDVFVELVKSIAGLIVTYEIRLRSLPDSLDKKKNKLLARNLFLAAWYAYRMEGKPKMTCGFLDHMSDEVDIRLTLFQRFIRKLIECDEIEKSVESKNESLKTIISNSIESIHSENEKETCLFLRRVCLADHFLLIGHDDQEEPSKFIDWDELLSIDSLSARFNVQFNFLNNNFEFKPFVFTKLPKEFIRFGQSPFNFPVDQTQETTLFNLLDYNFYIQHYSDFSENEGDVMSEIDLKGQIQRKSQNESIEAFLRLVYSRKNYPSVLMCIGNFASSLIVIDNDKIGFLRPFFLDRFGCTDVGFKRNQPLFLNQDRYERFMDEILSGDFSNDLHPFQI